MGELYAARPDLIRSSGELGYLPLPLCCVKDHQNLFDDLKQLDWASLRSFWLDVHGPDRQIG